jgi:flagellar biosynthesis protein FlhF
VKIKRYFAKDMRSALDQVKQELGPDAVIMSNKKTATGIEIVAAVDNDSVIQSAKETAQNIAQSPQKAMSAYSSLTDGSEQSAKVASSLQELLSRQVTDSSSKPIESDKATELTNRVLSEKAESEFEQWLSKARTTVTQEAESTEQVVSYDIDKFNPVEEQTVLDSEHQSQSIERHQAESLLSDTNVIHAEFDSEIASLKSELSSIKELLQHQVSNLMWQDLQRSSPVKALLISKLKDMGLSEEVADHLSHFVSDDLSQDEAWEQMLDLLTKQLDTTSNEIITKGGVFSLVGPTGVGKTTTIAKLAARYAKIHGADKVGLITTDSFRIGALEQLATYAKILGCPLKHAKNSDELSDAIFQLRNKNLILIDTAGMSQRDLNLTKRLTNLLTKSRVNIKNYLVLSATSQMSVLQESAKHFRTLPLSGCIFTKIDESLSLGELMSVAIHNRLPIGYLTNGQRVPEDIRVANSEKIVQKANQLYELKQKIKRKNKVVPHAVGMYD